MKQDKAVSAMILYVVENIMRMIYFHILKNLMQFFISSEPKRSNYKVSIRHFQGL